VEKRETVVRSPRARAAAIKAGRTVSDARVM